MFFRKKKKEFDLEAPPKPMPVAYEPPEEGAAPPPFEPAAAPPRKPARMPPPFRPPKRLSPPPTMPRISKPEPRAPEGIHRSPKLKTFEDLETEFEEADEGGINELDYMPEIHPIDKPHPDDFIPKHPRELREGRAERGPAAAIDIKRPELLRAFVELVSNRATPLFIDALDGQELTIQELAGQTGLDLMDIKSIAHRMVCMGLIEEFWCKTPSGNHINKYRLKNTKGNIEFDLTDLKHTLSVEELSAKSRELVNLVSAEGRIPRSLAMKELDLEEDAHLEQILRYTEIFKLPEIRSSVSAEATRVSEEIAPQARKPERVARKREAATEDIAEIEKYLKKLE